MATTPTSSISIREIGRAAGVQFSLVTRHFGSKEALLRAGLEEIITSWVAAMIDGAPDGLVDRAVDYLSEHPFDVAGIRLLTVDESTFVDGRSPVVDAIVRYFAQAGRRVEAVDVSAALALMLGWMSAEKHWVTTCEMSADEARDIIKGHAWRCLHPSGAAAFSAAPERDS